MPEDIGSILMMAVFAVIGIWLVMFVVRKLIGIALVAAVIIGGLMVWQNPSMLLHAQDTATRYYAEWHDGGVSKGDPQRR
ncbi:hypothetical protein [Agrobacterium rubi]|uniref:Uncharacterized protein n=1 Tax=Agrobacterium rubi TaxID=28099 RepID=A0AAE7R5F9_9HYPH|nr:hypothetical protein [Agrobacterium rubi]NTE85270.1 hypothetical protein [Agrobacterium rubi]NTF01202.1 hypothetical protein [Agrobacterium rubi]NTF35390.1 hypothetical protein [Agrobacterium rubi]OCJ48601.1 hypothetical protein A6U92_10730 [Agrobacterium rubi]QTG00583.1 hypothetical protein G6M88_09320 [Agrobacterium rubi]